MPLHDHSHGSTRAGTVQRYPRGLVIVCSASQIGHDSLDRAAVRALALEAIASPGRLSCISLRLACCRLASSRVKPASPTSISGQISCLYASRAQRHTLIILRSTVSARGSAQRRVGAKFTSASTLYLSLVQQESVRPGLAPRHRLWMRLQASIAIAAIAGAAQPDRWLMIAHPT